MRVSVHSHLQDLSDDLAGIPKKARKDMVAVTREALKAGNELAKGYARRSAGKTGKLYHKAFRAEMHSSLFGSGSSTISGEYGPLRGMPQGNMEFEYGSRNQPPHMDLNRSADVIGGSFAQEVAALPDKWFW